MLSAVIEVTEQPTWKHNTEWSIVKSNCPIGLLARSLKLRVHVYKSHGRQNIFTCTMTMKSPDIYITGKIVNDVQVTIWQLDFHVPCIIRNPSILIRHAVSAHYAILYHIWCGTISDNIRCWATLNIIQKYYATHFNICQKLQIYFTHFLTTYTKHIYEIKVHKIK